MNHCLIQCFTKLSVLYTCNDVISRLKMKKGTIISRLYVTLDMDDDNYLPNHFVVVGGELHDLQTLNDVKVHL